jgi:protein-disulfide isomerase
MKQRWLAFLSIGVLSVIIFIFFWYTNRPIEIPIPEIDVEIGSLSEPTVTYINPSKGPTDAPLTIVEFGDFECGPCQALATSLEVVHLTYPDEVQVVWKNLPNESLHQLATPAAIAAHCADRQGMFWEYHDELFLRQTYLAESQFEQIASSLGLDIEKFQTCYEQRDTLPIVTKDFEEGIALGLTSTPSLYVGDDVYTGALTTDALLSIVEDALNQL